MATTFDRSAAGTRARLAGRFGVSLAPYPLIALLLFPFIAPWLDRLDTLTLGPLPTLDVAVWAQSLHQAWWALLTVAVLPLALGRGRLLRALAAQSGFLLATLAFCWLSLLWAQDAAHSAAEAARLSLSVVCSAILIAALPTKRAFFRLALLTSGAVLVLDLLVLIVWPTQGFDPVSGVFIGVHGAGETVAAFALIAALLWGQALVRARKPREIVARSALLAAALLLIVAAEAWATALILTLTVPAALLLELLRRRGRAPLGVLLSLGFVALVVLGNSRASAPFWAMLGEYWQTGLGYGTLWLTPPVAADAEELARALKFGANGYLDLLAWLGVLGTVLAVLALLTPFIIALRLARRGDLGERLVPCLVVLSACLMHNTMTGSLWHPDSGLWLAALIALLYVALEPLSLRRFFNHQRRRGRRQRRARARLLRRNGRMVLERSATSLAAETNPPETTLPVRRFDPTRWQGATPSAPDVGG